MICPHCSHETQPERTECAFCGRSLAFTADSVFAAPEEKKDEGTEWGPKLLRYVVGLAILACILAYGASYLGPKAGEEGKVDDAPLAAPGEPPALIKVTNPSPPEEPSPPKSLPQAALVKPKAIELSVKPRHVRLGFGSRDPEVRKLFLERNGGNDATERAVVAGLKWLSTVQDDDGSWNHQVGVMPKKVEGKEPQKPPDHSLGVTGLALLAFLGHGHTHLKGEHKDIVKKAIDYVLSKEKDGRFPGALYHQGICTMALAEAYGLTGETWLEPPTRRAVEFIVKAQNTSGGWNYSPGGDRGDTSVTGWQIMALKSARKAGIDFDKEVFKKGTAYIASVARPDGHIRYDNQRAEEAPHPAMTAAGLNTLLFMGSEVDGKAVLSAIDALMGKLPKKPSKTKQGTWRQAANIYLWYHGSLALSRIGGREWEAWNARVRAFLLATQHKEKGYWHTCGDPWVSRGGRVYFTSLAILALEVYYRYD